MKNEPLIVWEKWSDPFGQEMDDAKWTDYDNQISNNFVDPMEDEYDEEEIEEDEQQIIEPPSMPKGIRVIASPMGLIPYNELTAPCKIFNFWVGHTNFNISPKVAKIIEESDGVEILDIFTRYRFRIAIGKCFTDADTMKNISDRINNLFNNEVV